MRRVAFSAILALAATSVYASEEAAAEQSKSEFTAGIKNTEQPKPEFTVGNKNTTTLKGGLTAYTAAHEHQGTVPRAVHQ